jgi:hypothetical protein
MNAIDWFHAYYNHPSSTRVLETRNGVSLRAGYARGCALEWNGYLRRLYEDQPDFRKARELVGQATITTDPKIANLWTIIAIFLEKIPHGHICEFGSYKGGLAVIMALAAKRYRPGVKVYSFDTFKGMPPTDDVDHHVEGDFSDNSVEAVQALADRCGADNLVLVPGLFADTAARTLAEIDGPIALAHLDSDIYSALSDSYEAVKPHMTPGGYYVFDDPTFSSCVSAFNFVEDVLVRRDGLSAEQAYPHLVYRAPGLT